MRVLVTGASGFVGISLTPTIQTRGHFVCTEDDRPYESVVHLANIAHRTAHPAELYRVNVEGTRRQALAALAAGARRFVYISSAMALASGDVYGRTKLAAEKILAQISGLETVVLRPPLVYGPRVKANFLALMRAISHGWPLPFASIENRRSLIYVGNLCDAIICCLEAPQAAGRTYGVSDGTPVSTPQLCAALGDALGRPARLFKFPVPLLELAPGLKRLTRSLEVDDRAIRQELGWKPPHTFEEGLRLTAEWYLARRG